MELDVIRPLLLEGKMPNLSSVIKKGVYGKLRTVSAPNCPRVFSTMFTSTEPEEHGVTGFIVGGITGVLCAPKLSEVEGGDAVYPPSLKAELLKNVGDFYIDCERMPSAADLQGHESAEIDAWLAKVQLIRDQQTRLFAYILDHHPTDFTWLGQSCEDRTGHWLYPIAPYNAGYNPKINAVRTEAFPDQYVAFDKVLGEILKHVDENTYLIIVSDHGIKPLREFEETDPHAHMDHEKTTPVIAKHDFADGDDVPGAFFAMGPGIKQNLRLMGFAASVYDVAPTILHLYGIEQPPQMRGHVLSDIFVNAGKTVAER
jgi:predicted AlkP superfamily phosphohydrolase/phosphomutase